MDRAFALRKLEDIDASFQEIKQLQAAWREVGPVPPKKQTMLWKQFKKANDLFFEKYNNTKGIVPKPRVNPFLEALTAMTAEAEALLINQQDFVAASGRAKQLLVNWKETSAKMKSAPDRQLSDRFRAACDKVFEMNYLVRVIGYRHPFFAEKPRIEQLKIMINQMDYLVRKEKTDLMQYDVPQNSYGNSYGRSSVNEEERAMLSKLNTQKRKIAMKEILLIDFKRELDQLLA